MIKTKTITQTEEIEVVDNIICNMCGKPCPDPMDVGQWEYAMLSAHWGYGSHRDGRVEKSHICPDCYERLVDMFVIKPTCESNDGFMAYDEDYDEPVGEEDEPQTHERMERLLNEPSVLDESSEDDNG